jgi:hypothetical protein
MFSTIILVYSMKTMAIFKVNMRMSMPWGKATYVRVMLIDYSSGFSTIVPSKLITMRRALGLDTSLCNWILDFLTGRPQGVRVGNNASATLALNTMAPQGCVLSPLLYSLFTHDCVTRTIPNTIVKVADDTTA